MFLCPHSAVGNLGSNLTSSIKAKKMRITIPKHTKFIKKSNGKIAQPSIKSGRPKASFWLLSLALGAPYFKR